MENSVLFLSFSGPYPPHDGKKQRSLALLKALEQQYQVDYLIIDQETDYQLAINHNENKDTIFLKINSSRSNWQEICKKLGRLFFKDKEITNYIYQLHKEKKYQFVFSRYIQPVTLIPKGIKIIADVDDNFIELYRSRIQQAKSWYKKIRLNQILLKNLQKYKRLKNRLDLSILVKQEKGFQNPLILPNLPFQLLFQDQIDFIACTQPSLLFVGKLTYEPNLNGIKWFIENVYPKLLEKIPDLPLTIVSTFDVVDEGLDRLLKKYPAITKKINLEDIQTAYHTHAMVIAPIFQGAGSNLKVTEALLMGRPVVTTSFGAKGFEENDDFLNICEDINSFFEQTKSILERTNLGEIQETIFEKSNNKFALKDWNKDLTTGIKKII
ncbi:glycosyltransferase [Algoriphagus algorifonticola]|uniref:glycosyltransferase n=1 Tax=Algoriphagus algorifonticola TaxID=2593007 RepID=UPI0011A57AD4|nr:glycosyltransferase [Algoriphagus algorifonticola]